MEISYMWIIAVVIVLLGAIISVMYLYMDRKRVIELKNLLQQENQEMLSLEAEPQVNEIRVGGLLRKKYDYQACIRYRLKIHGQRSAFFYDHIIKEVKSTAINDDVRQTLLRMAEAATIAAVPQLAGGYVLLGFPHNNAHDDNIHPVPLHDFRIEKNSPPALEADVVDTE